MTDRKRLCIVIDKYGNPFGPFDLMKEGDRLLSPRMIEDGEPPNPIPWPDPTPEMLASPEFESVWQCIKRWDINVPNAYAGYCGATGNHVRAILDALKAQR